MMKTKKNISTKFLMFAVVMSLSVTSVYASEVTGTLGSSATGGSTSTGSQIGGTVGGSVTGGTTNPVTPTGGNGGGGGGGGGGGVVFVPSSNPGGNGGSVNVLSGTITAPGNGSGGTSGNGGGLAQAPVAPGFPNTVGTNGGGNGGIAPTNGQGEVVPNDGLALGIPDFTPTPATTPVENPSLLASILNAFGDWNLWWLILIILLGFGTVYYFAREDRK